MQYCRYWQPHCSHQKDQISSVTCRIYRMLDTINEVLKSFNAKVNYLPRIDEIIIDSSGTLSSEAQFEYVRKMRASILVMGPF